MRFLKIAVAALALSGLGGCLFVHEDNKGDVDFSWTFEGGRCYSDDVDEIVVRIDNNEYSEHGCTDGMTIQGLENGSYSYDVTAYYGGYPTYYYAGSVYVDGNVSEHIDLHVH